MSRVTGGKPAECLPSHAQLYQVDVPQWASKLNGRDIRDFTPAEFARAIKPLGLSVDQSLGHSATVEQFVSALRSTYDRAGREAVEKFLQEAPKQ